MKENLKIAVLAPYRIYPAVSGGQRCTALLYKYLSELIPVTILSVESNDTPTGKVTLKKIMGTSILRYANPLLFFRVRRYLKANAFTHLVIEHPYFGWLGWMLKRSLRIPLIVHSHNIEGQRFRTMGKWWWRLLSSYESWTHRRANMNFFITPEDLDHALTAFKLKKENCSVITYGTELKEFPSPASRGQARKQLCADHEIGEEETILLFNGVLNYGPNLDAIDTILKNINPILSAMPGYKYRILVCGKDLPGSYDDLKAYRNKHITYTGFVVDISRYFLGADIFINPVTDGGGIKTKLVEALGYNLSAVSTVSGAIGIPVSVSQNKLYTVPDDDSNSFCRSIREIRPGMDTPASFYQHFYWGAIAEKVSTILSKII